MASSYTEGLVIELIGSGDKAGSWGDVTNSNLQALNQGVSGFSDIDLSSVGSSPYTIDLVDAQAVSESTSPSRSSVIRFDGHSDGFQVNFQTNTSASERINCIIVNGHASNSLVVGTGTGGTVTIPATYSARIHGDGSGLENSFANLAVDKIALKNTEIISNETDNEILIGADKVILGDGTGDVTLESNGNNNLIVQTGHTDTGTMTIVDGSNGDISITPHGTGKVVMDKVNIGGGEIDGTPIGANSANTGAFTSVATTSDGNITADGSGDISTTSGDILTASGSMGVGVSSPGGSGNISADGTITTSGNITTTGSGSITTAGGLNVTSGGIDVDGGGLDLAGGGITNSGTINTPAISSGTISGAAITGGSINNTPIGGGTPNTGSFTSVTADDIVLNGKVITMTGSTGDTATLTAGTNGTLDIATTDAAGTAANIQITADGTAELAGTTVTLDASSNITLDADGGTVTFANDGVSLGTITSSGYSGNAATVTNGVYTTNKINVLAATSSAELAGVISDETGTGSLVFATSPTLVTPALGTPASGVMTNVTGTAAGLTAGSATLAISTSALKSASTTVNVDSSSAPSAGQVLTATSASAAEWKDSTVGDVTGVTGGTNITVTSGTGPVPDVNLDSAISLTSVTASSTVTTPTLTSAGALAINTASNGNLTVAPNGTGKVSISSASTAFSQGSEAININASAGRIGLEVGEDADIISFRIPIASASTTPVLQAFLNDEGLAIHESGGGYINFSSTTGSTGNGFKASGGNAPVEFKAKRDAASNNDGWGRIYHSGMVSGDGAYFEGTCSVTANTEPNLTTGFESIPSIVTGYLECTSDDNGYSDGDHVLVSSVLATNLHDNSGVSVTFDGAAANDVTVTIGFYGIYLLNKTTGILAGLDESKWIFRLKAWK